MLQRVPPMNHILLGRTPDSQGLDGDSLRLANTVDTLKQCPVERNS